MSVSAFAAFGVAVIGGVSHGWGKSRLESADSNGKHDTLYLAAMNGGPAVALIATILGIALQAGGAP